MAERLKAAVLKTVVLQRYRGFESLSLRLWLRVLEWCESGRIGLPAKELYPYGYRGFESPLLRKTQFCVLFEAIAQLDRASDCGSEGRQFEPA